MFCKVQRFTVFFVLASQLFMMLPTLGKQNIVDIFENEPRIHNTSSGVHVGGGRIPLFDLDELLPHVDLSGKCIDTGAS